MNRPHDRLVPIKLRSTKTISNESPNFADIVQVNSLLEKRSLKNKINTNNSNDNEHFITLASLRNKNIKYENQKQEQYHRLDRKSKIQQNTEWMDFIKNEEINKKPNLVNPKTCFQQIKETNRQIDAANKELDFINSAISKRRSISMNKSFPSSQSKIILPVTSGSKSKLASNTSNRKHLCSKGIYPDKLNEINALKNISDKPMLDDENIFDNTFSKIKSKPSHKRLNALRNKRVDATISLVDDKLKKVNSKYFNADYETHLKTIVQKKPKYRSVKDLLKNETDKIRLPTMEASKLIQNELEKDLNLPGNKERILNKHNYQTQVLYENLDFLENQVFHDNFSDEDKKEKNKQNVQKQIPSPRSPKISSPVVDQQNQLAHKTGENFLKKEEAKSKTIETMTKVPPKSALEAAILRSDYLRREFNMNTSETNLVSPNFTKLDPKIEKQSWSRDIEYLMK